MEIHIRLKETYDGEHPNTIKLTDMSMQDYFDICDNWSKSLRSGGVLMVDLPEDVYKDTPKVAIPASEIRFIVIASDETESLKGSIMKAAGIRTDCDTLEEEEEPGEVEYIEADQGEVSI